MARHVPVYGVFIIESMDWENERDNKLDGAALHTILNLCDIDSEYIYIRTKKELEHAMKLYEETDFGFLHISCHGNANNLCLTMDDIGFEEIGAIMGSYLKYRRLFLSACKVASYALAEYFIPRHHCYSIMGSPDTIDYDKAAIFWSTYYYLMYKDDQQRMWQRNIIPTLKNITRTFSESLNYFSIINEGNPNARCSLRALNFTNGEKAYDHVLKTRFENLYWDEAIAEKDDRPDDIQLLPPTDNS